MLPLALRPGLHPGLPVRRRLIKPHVDKGQLYYTQPLPLSSRARSCIRAAVTVNTWHRGAATDHKAESIYSWLLTGSVPLTPGPQQNHTCWVQAAAVCHLRQPRDTSPSPSFGADRFLGNRGCGHTTPPTSPQGHGLCAPAHWDALMPDSPRWTPGRTGGPAKTRLCFFHTLRWNLCIKFHSSREKSALSSSLGFRKLVFNNPNVQENTPMAIWEKM